MAENLGLKSNNLYYVNHFTFDYISANQCMDDENNDCAQLNSILNICADIHHAKLICKKTCNLCGLGMTSLNSLI